jgi:hypothetical protein
MGGGGIITLGVPFAATSNGRIISMFFFNKLFSGAHPATNRSMIGADALLK